MENCFKKLTLIAITAFISTISFAKNDNDTKQKEENGAIIVEAEDFLHQARLEKRSWVIKEIKTSPEQAYIISEASSKCFIEALPDSRVNENSIAYPQENYSDVPGTVAELFYDVEFKEPGKYYVWARVYSTGNYDCSMHVGINGDWPKSGERMIWTEGKNSWNWDCRQFSENNENGTLNAIYLEVPKAGIHRIAFSMRDDGVKFDSFLLTSDKSYVPNF